jgi:hypothetical protein
MRRLFARFALHCRSDARADHRSMLAVQRICAATLASAHSTRSPANKLCGNRMQEFAHNNGTVRWFADCRPEARTNPEISAGNIKL